MPKHPRFSGRTSYHHGDLKAAVRKTALELIIERQEVDFSLREIAARLQVSHPALYRHFANKRAVIAAVAEEGFKLITEALANAKLKTDSSPTAVLRAQARAYIEFAVQWPGHFRSMFHRELSEKDDFPDLRAGSDAALGMLQESIHAARAAGILRDASDDAIVLHFWSCVHGFSELLLKKQFPTARKDDRLMLEQRINELIGFLECALTNGVKFPHPQSLRLNQASP